MCPLGTYTLLAGSVGVSSCLPCPPGSTCFLAGDRPIVTAFPVPLRSTTILDPLQQTQEQSNIALSNITIAISIAGACLIALLLAVAVWAEKQERFEFLKSCDILFAGSHFRPSGSLLAPVVPSILGGGVTAAAIVAIAFLSALLACQNYYIPTYVSTVTSVPPPFDPHGTFRMTADVVGNGFGACATANSSFQYPASYFSSTNGQFIGSDSTAWYAPPFIGIGYISAEWDLSATGAGISMLVANDGTSGACRMTWTCSKCRMVGASATLNVQAVSTWAFANYIQYKFETPLMTSSVSQSGEGSSSVPFTISGYIFPLDKLANTVGAVFRVPIPPPVTYMQQTTVMCLSPMAASGQGGCKGSVSLPLTPLVFQQSMSDPSPQVGFQASIGSVMSSGQSQLASNFVPIYNIPPVDGQQNAPFVSYPANEGFAIPIKLTQNQFSIVTYVVLAFYISRNASHSFAKLKHIFWIC